MDEGDASTSSPLAIFKVLEGDQEYVPESPAPSALSIAVPPTQIEVSGNAEIVGISFTTIS